MIFLFLFVHDTDTMDQVKLRSFLMDDGASFIS
jgi:hypothetical protein